MVRYMPQLPDGTAPRAALELYGIHGIPLQPHEVKAANRDLKAQGRSERMRRWTKKHISEHWTLYLADVFARPDMDGNLMDIRETDDSSGNPGIVG